MEILTPLCLGLGVIFFYHNKSARHLKKQYRDRTTPHKKKILPPCGWGARVFISCRSTLESPGTELEFVIGISGSGKSTYLFADMMRKWQFGRRVIAIDPKGGATRS
uniref:TrsE n=1 Tax=Bacillus thuringiensis serovar chinensis CT-43 TaxID=541229 RepID=E7CGK1_BACTU|nr:TrsE [Bacillus thuringiensis serovar chinensis CT-43]